MTKAIFLIFVVLIAYWIFSGHFRRSGNQGVENVSAPQTKDPEKIVVCAHCHLHIPEKEALSAGGLFFCCDEHRQLGQS